MLSFALLHLPGFRIVPSGGDSKLTAEPDAPIEHQPELAGVEGGPIGGQRAPRSGVLQGPDLHRRIQRYGWDLAVAPYQEFWLSALEPCAARALSLVSLRPGEKVLDIATGTGTAALLAADLVGASGGVVATDLAGRMVAAVQAETERRGVTWLECWRADTEALPFDDATFDVVTCVLGLMYPAEPIEGDGRNVPCGPPRRPGGRLRVGLARGLRLERHLLHRRGQHPHRGVPAVLHTGRSRNAGRRVATGRF
ncbi:MAG: methyltransferase domain-containing protein [Dehalococcoidia bacterium]|nr:methyltransferase domain-containing protein [Dehalococcoidia bacterium]